MTSEIDDLTYFADRVRLILETAKMFNDQGEYLLTDMFAHARRQGRQVAAVLAPDMQPLTGVNDRVQLAALERYLQRSEAESLMRSGVTVVDPARIDVRGELQVGTDSSIDINCVFIGSVVLGKHAIDINA